MGIKIARVFIYLANTRDGGHFGKIPKRTSTARDRESRWEGGILGDCGQMLSAFDSLRNNLFATCSAKTREPYDHFMKCQKKGHLGREAFFIITLLNDK